MDTSYIIMIIQKCVLPNTHLAIQQRYNRYQKQYVVVIYYKTIILGLQYPLNFDVRMR